MSANQQPSSIGNHLMRFVLSMGFVMASWFLVPGTASHIHGQTPADGAPQAPLSELVSKLRQQNGLIGLAAMVAVDGKVIDSAVDGLRLKGRDVPLDIKDRWHLGSITKSITATMIGRLVESGKMQWTDKVGDYFKDGDNGSNTMWYALVLFIPEKKMVIAVTSNDGDIAKAEAAAWKIVQAKAPPELAKQL